MCHPWRHPSGAQLLKRDEEQRLVLAVQRADAERHARQTAIRFGVVVDAYRDYRIREGKDYKRAKSLIDKIEAFVGADRDTAAVDFAIYQGLLATVAVHRLDGGDYVFCKSVRDLAVRNNS